MKIEKGNIRPETYFFMGINTDSLCSEYNLPI